MAGAQRSPWWLLLGGVVACCSVMMAGAYGQTSAPEKEDDDGSPMDLSDAVLGSRIFSTIFFSAFGLWLWNKRPDPNVPNERERRFNFCSAVNSFMLLYTGLFNLVQLSRLDNIRLDNGFEVDTAKYVQYCVTCPVITYQLVELGGGAFHRKVEITLQTFMMLSFALFASIIPERGYKMIVFCCGAFFFGIVIYTMNLVIQESTNFKENLFEGTSYLRKTALVVMLSWIPFPITWLIGPEGFDVMSGDLFDIIFTVCDLVAKVGFSMYIFQVKTAWKQAMLKGEMESWEKADEASRIGQILARIQAGDLEFLDRVEEEKPKLLNEPIKGDDGKDGDPEKGIRGDRRRRSTKMLATVLAQLQGRALPQLDNTSTLMSMPPQMMQPMQPMQQQQQQKTPISQPTSPHQQPQQPSTPSAKSMVNNSSSMMMMPPMIGGGGVGGSGAGPVEPVSMAAMMNQLKTIQEEFARLSSSGGGGSPPRSSIPDEYPTEFIAQPPPQGISTRNMNYM
ncbi:unnamed protein product [Vitrella brassicaformis CCMP3155]|uniref:Uncharacterized protein n=2 Tax=Vitrella brassicaformis TaxID=1169539 RepID=A0A0G4GF51_VITBC|nr:unnamed protein product [Vitrella brassicaformis CCMP3155]|eukprot:CEM28120.1 unnamed protein product [Vitrella brassicaformis CCMP3155]